MILRLLPNQLNRYWDTIRYGLLALPSPVADTSAEGLQNVLASLLSEQAQCWVTFTTENGETKIKGFAITFLVEDRLSRKKILNIHALFFLGAPEEGTFEEGIRAIKTFAKANGCAQITAFTTIPGIERIATKLGFTSNCKLLLSEV